MITSNIFRDMIISAANNIFNNKDAVDQLNVFPVPDGDTGTNMSMTMSAAAKELAGAECATVSAVADIAAAALLRGARGNSGVILSLLFRGISRGFKGKAAASAADFAYALKLGVESAYKAVMKPTEGTVLTVARVAAEQAEQYAANEPEPAEMLQFIIQVAEETLAKTPDMLPVLKQAGVVDAGGKGFVIILKGMLSVLKDGVVIEADSEPKEKAEKPQSQSVFDGFEDKDIEYTYCTEFIINKRDDAIADEVNEFHDYIESIGDSVVVVDDDAIVKVHVHTNNPGKVIEKAITLGYLTNIKIDNMRQQHNHLINSEEESQPAEPAPAEKKYGFVAVAAGEELKAIFKDLGVDRIINGGQTMNPSTENILNAINRTPAEIVYVLPNNKNIIMAAEMAVPMTTKKVYVIPSKTIPQGLSAMLVFDASADEEQNFNAMSEAINSVKTAQVTYAVRDSVFDGQQINEGQILGLLENKVSVVGDDINSVALELLDRIWEGASYINIYYGNGITDKQAEELRAQVADKYGEDIEIGLLKGGQPVYYYIISAE